jgi:hypothetical protein
MACGIGSWWERGESQQERDFSDMRNELLRTTKILCAALKLISKSQIQSLPEDAINWYKSHVQSDINRAWREKDESEAEKIMNEIRRMGWTYSYDNSFILSETRPIADHSEFIGNERE